jgi:ubiquinone/menaquinone biosynthesis C-methylase UbiE
MPLHDTIIDDNVLSLVPKHFGGLILDMGCGWGLWGFRMRLGREVHGPLVGLDVFASNLKKLKKFDLYDELVLADARFTPFKDGAVDIVLAGEIIEHLPKEEGYILLKEIERVSRGKIIITTPRGFMLQASFQGNIFEKHRSGWTEKDFINKGYNIIFVGRPKIFLRPTRVTFIINTLFDILPQSTKKRLPKQFMIAVRSK